MYQEHSHNNLFGNGVGSNGVERLPQLADRLFVIRNHHCMPHLQTKPKCHRTAFHIYKLTKTLQKKNRKFISMHAAPPDILEFLCVHQCICRKHAYALANNVSEKDPWVLEPEFWDLHTV